MTKQIAALALAAMMGCATNPATGVQSNGAQLRIKSLSGTGSFTTQEAGAEHEHYDANGNYTGKSVDLVNVEHSYEWNAWDYYQGNTALDEQDYYRIAGDNETTKDIEHRRARAAHDMKVGMPIAIAGLAVSMVLSGIAATEHSVPLYYGSVVPALIGLYGAYRYKEGHDVMTNHHLYDFDHASVQAVVVEMCREGQGCVYAKGGKAGVSAADGGAAGAPPPPSRPA
jgi:hypothetical protein